MQDEQSLHVDHTEGAQQNRSGSSSLLSQARFYKAEAEEYRGWKGVAGTVTLECGEHSCKQAWFAVNGGVELRSN